MDKVITTALLIVISVVLSLVLFNAAYPAILQSGDAISSMADRSAERLRSQIAIVHCAGELDSTGAWSDTNGNGLFDVFIWVKNVGSTRVFPIDSLDVFFGPEGNFSRLQGVNQAGGTYPRWTAAVEGGGDWVPASTLKITIQYLAPLTSNWYFVKVTTPAGISASDYLGL